MKRFEHLLILRWTRKPRSRRRSVRSLTTSYGLFDVSKRVLVNNHSDEFPFMNPILGAALWLAVLLALFTREKDDLTVFLLTMFYVGYSQFLGLLYYVALGAAAGLVLHQYRLIKDRTREGCFKAFLSNNWMGLVIWVGIVLDLLFRIRIFK